MKLKLSLFFLLAACSCLADGPIIQTSPFARQLLRAPDAATARSDIGVFATNNWPVTNVELRTPTVVGGTLSGATNLNPILSGGLWSSPSFTGGWWTNPIVTGGAWTNPIIVSPTINGGSFVGGKFSGNGQGMSNTTASAISIAQSVYLQSGFENFTNNTGDMVIGYSFDGETFYYINGGKSVWNGRTGSAGVPGFVPDIIIWTNGLAYIAYQKAGNGQGQTNIYIGVSSNLLDWSYLTTITDAAPSAAVVGDNTVYPSKFFLDHDGTLYLTYSKSTNALSTVGFRLYAAKALDGTLTNWISGLPVTGPSSGDLGNTWTDWQPLWTGSNYVMIASSAGLYGVMFTNTPGSSLLANYSQAGQIETTTGGLLKGEGFNEVAQPDGTYNVYYDDGPNNALVGFTRYITSKAAVLTNITTSYVGSPVSDDSYPYCPGRVSPIRHGQVWLCTNLPPAMVSALLTAKVPTGILWDLNSVNSPNFHSIRSPGTGKLVMSNIVAAAQTSPVNLSPLNAGLVLDCSLIEGNGTNVFDYSPNYLQGIITGSPAWTNGLVGYALNLTNNTPEGSVWLGSATNAVRMPMPPELTNRFTFETVFLQPAWGASGSAVVSYIGIPGTVNAFYQDIFPNGLGTFIQGPLTGNQFNDGPLLTNVWVDLVTTFDGASLNIYTNGVLSATHPWANGFTNLTSGNAIVGFGAMRSGGLSGAVRVWDRALNTNEIKLLYRQSFSP